MVIIKLMNSKETSEWNSKSSNSPYLGFGSLRQGIMTMEQEFEMRINLKETADSRDNRKTG